MTLSTPRITPHLWFDKEAVEAARFYVSVFPNSSVDKIDRIEGTPSGDCDIVSFTLAGQPFMAISAGPMFKFNEAISLLVPCETQEEIDHYHVKLAADPARAQCGWIKDRYGLSWQIWPKAIGELMEGASEAQKTRMTKAIMTSKKFDIAELKRAFAGG
jgi:predicted 3-demethylubiquinone-9 3-methyltransferase (glyoxalase superfamily)